jgi:ribonuclease R
MKMAEYMMKHIGEEFTGIISSTTNFGMFVELPNLIEGLVRLENIKDDYYEFDEETMTIRGKKNKKGYRLGDTIKVKVLAANKDARTIDFTIVTEDKKDGDKQSQSLS